jgi:hypothetical protein
MALDPDHPPIWLRKLHVAAEQISPDDYAQTPEEGILMGCRLSDAVRVWSLACAQALGFSSLPPRPPLDNPFRLNQLADRPDSGPRKDDAAH